MTDFATLLNEEQLAAATAPDGPLLALAAAGTGKTRTLVYRVAYLTEQGIPPDNLLLLTFTNRAAREMLERAKQLVGDSVGTIWSGTFHHVCNRFLRRFGSHLGYRPDFTILDRDDARSLMDQCIGATVTNKKDFPKKDVLLSLVGMAANKTLDVAELAEEQADALNADPKLIVSVAARYADQKREMGAMDFDDLLVNGLRLLEESDYVRRLYQQKFRHILVDEYQDTNLLQARMVDILAEQSRNVMAVGDDFQCIYSWRGANFKNIMEFPKRWPDCRIVKLEQSYRSAPEILQVANACIKGNPEQFQKELRATRPSRHKPQFYLLRDGDEQAYAVLGLIERYLDEGYSLKDMAVLYRAHFHSIELQMALARRHIPCVITSGVGIFEQAHTKDVLAFLRMCEYPHDKMAFMRLVGLLRGVGEKTVASYWEKLGGQFNSRNAEQREALCGMMRPAARGQWQEIDRIFAAYHDEHLTGTDAVRRFVEVFYHSYLVKEYDPENAKTREEDVNELAVQMGKSGSVTAFLEEVPLLSGVDQAEHRLADELPPDAVRLSTVHQAKGLEWPIVFVIWAVEGMFPSNRSIDESEDDSEERRLFYVAVTRAKDELVLCAPSIRFARDGGCFPCKPSRFIKELPKGLVTERYGFRRY